MGLRLIVAQLEIFILEIKNILHIWIDVHDGEFAGSAGKLSPHLVEMIVIDMRIAKGMDEFTRFQACHLRDHHEKQSVGGNIEWHTQETVGAALIEHQRQSAVGNIELKQQMAGRKSHVGN